MKCIFCLQEKPPSDEHVIPESIGGRLCIKEVCRECNSDLSRLVDNPFASCSIVQLARYNHSVGGKRNIVPFPFGGIGTTDAGQRISLDEKFNPHVKREFEIKKLPDGSLAVHFIADVSDTYKLEDMLGKPLKKALAIEFPTWPPEKLDAEVARILAYARTQSPISEHKPIKKRWQVGLDDLLFEFLKIAYEMWFRRFGYPWVEQSETARLLRTAILNRDPSLPIRGQLFCPDIPLPVSDPLRNHLVLKMNGLCFIRLFNITCGVGCEASDARFVLRQEDAQITIQDFIAGTLTEAALPAFLAENSPPNPPA